MFVIWASAKAHVMLTHTRDLKRYPAKFDFRVSKLSESDRVTLAQLLTRVVPDLPAANSRSPGMA
eukprot:2747882-Lingulodinium_polyedra.AAC.1